MNDVPITDEELLAVLSKNGAEIAKLKTKIEKATAYRKRLIRAAAQRKDLAGHRFILNADLARAAGITPQGVQWILDRPAGPGEGK